MYSDTNESGAWQIQTIGHSQNSFEHFGNKGSGLGEATIELNRGHS